MTFISNSTVKYCLVPCDNKEHCSCYISSTNNKMVSLASPIPSLDTLNFREMRKTKRLTLRSVEDCTGISNAYLSQLETGNIKNPSYTVVKTLFDLYNT